MNYIEENNKINQKSRKHNILWFNPPYSESVKTNISNLFLPLINLFRQCINSEQYSTETLLKLAIHVWPTSNQKLVHIKKVLNKLINQNTRPKYLLVKWKLLSKNNPVYSNNNMGEKELPTQKL